MRRVRAIAVAALVLIAVTPAQSDVPLPSAFNLLGSVNNAARPVTNALVIALNLTDYNARQTYSGGDGSFSLPLLPAGVYKIIALKQGFVPSITTLVSTKSSHRVTLALKNDKQARAKLNDELWEIRGSLPPDILRDIDTVLAPQIAVVRSPGPRIRGEMMSLTAVSDQSPAFAKTAVDVKSRFGAMQLGIRGNLHRIEDLSDDAVFGSPLAESSAMAVEFSSGENDTYRLASTKSWWLYKFPSDAGTTQAGVRAHNFEWEHGAARLQVRYLGQQNLYDSLSRGSDLFEIGGDTTLIQTARNEVGLSLHVMQENMRDTAIDPMRTADLRANGSLELVPSFVLHYGLSSRLAIDGTSWTPRTGAEWRVAGNTALIATAMYKVSDPQRSSALPTIVAGTDESRVLPRYAYSFGVISGDDESRRISAVATITAIDSPLRVVFEDGFEQFWSGLSIDAGDVRRDLRLSCRQKIGHRVAIDLSTSAGTATSARGHSPRKNYITGDLQSIYLPTGTALAISFRGLRQPQHDNEYAARRMNVRMSQPLHLPLDLTLLLGVEVARAENSPYLLDANALAERTYIGGLAVNF